MWVGHQGRTGVEQRDGYQHQHVASVPRTALHDRAGDGATCQGSGHLLWSSPWRLAPSTSDEVGTPEHRTMTPDRVGRMLCWKSTGVGCCLGLVCRCCRVRERSRQWRLPTDYRAWVGTAGRKDRFGVLCAGLVCVVGGASFQSE